jgi:hypothetical protein
MEWKVLSEIPGRSQIILESSNKELVTRDVSILKNNADYMMIDIVCHGHPRGTQLES